MTTTGVIDKAVMSKSGKTLRILVNDQWYSTPNFALQQAIGRTIQFDVSTSEYMGNAIYWANDAQLVQDVTPPQNAPLRSVPSSVTASELTARDYMPFTSNQVAHAIAAGLITDAKQMTAWAVAAFNAIKAATNQPEASIMTSHVDDLDDDIPF